MQGSCTTKALSGVVLQGQELLQVCWEHDDTAEDQMLQCDACHISVHMACYGVKSPPDGRLWLCDVCALGEYLCLQHPCS